MNAREDYYAKVKSQKKQSKGRRKNIGKCIANIGSDLG
jgi:hypothetical protein